MRREMGKRMHTSAVTFLLSSRSALFPASAITILGLPISAMNENDLVQELAE